MIVNKYTGGSAIKFSLSNLDLFIMQECIRSIKKYVSADRHEACKKWIVQK